MGFMGLKTSQRSLDSPGWSKTHQSPPEANLKENYGPYGLYMLPKAIFSINSASRDNCRQECNDPVPERHWTQI